MIIPDPDPRKNITDPTGSGSATLLFYLYPGLFSITIDVKYRRQYPIAFANSSSLIGRYLEERLDVDWSTVTLWLVRFQRSLCRTVDAK